MSSASIDRRNYIDVEQYPRIETKQIAVPSSFMRASPRPSASAETELLYGTLFHIHKKGRGWLWGQSESLLPGRKYPGYVGWVRRSHLESSYSSLTSFIVRVRTAPIFTQASIKSPVKKILSMGSVLTGNHHDGFLEIADGFVHLKHLMDASDDAPKDWVGIAEEFLECPYIWGGIGGFGLDCSGLVQTSLRMAGEDAPRDSDQQSLMGTEVLIVPDLTGLKRGDLVFWKGHVGIMVDHERLLHANAHHMKVACETLSAAVDRIMKNAGPVTRIRRL